MKINNQKDLQGAILALEEKISIEKDELVEHFHDTRESLKPINLIKNSIKKFRSSPKLADNAITSSLGLGTGFIVKKILIGKSNNFFTRMLGTAIELGVAKIVSKNSGEIKVSGAKFLKKIFKLKRQRA
jgi:hypothetical protein